jgi:hypothetical protein
MGIKRIVNEVGLIPEVPLLVLLNLVCYLAFAVNFEDFVLIWLLDLDDMDLV